jgi:hypothetical protein
MTEILLYAVVGFIAQLIDGALGMAFGITATSLLLSVGIPPATASATVHIAECVTTGVSGVSHHAFGNINPHLFRALVLPGMLGAAVGAYLLSSFPAEAFRPIIASYLIVMGIVIIVKAFREFPPKTVTRHLTPLGLLGGFFDAVGGGGWGPIVASNLIARGNAIRMAIGSTNAVEFFVALSASVTFILSLGVFDWRIILGLAVGGAIGAPIGAWACKHIPVKPFMIFVGCLIVTLSLRTLLVE